MRQLTFPFFTLAALFVLLFAFFENDVKTSYGSVYTVIEIRKNQATIKPSHYLTIIRLRLSDYR